MRLVNLRSIENQIWHCYRSLGIGIPTVSSCEHILNLTYIVLADRRLNKL